PHGEATATAVGPGVILTAAHVLWTNSPNTTQLPWENYRRWHPGVSSQNDPSYTNVVSIVSLTGYADAIDVYDLNQYDGGSPMEVFNRDAMVLLFSNDSATPYGFARAHPRAYQSGFLYDSNLYEVVGYPSAKYPLGDARGWKVHRTTGKERQWLNERAEDQFEPGYRYKNRLFIGSRALDAEAGNSGGPLLGRGQAGEPWLISGVVVGQDSLFRVMDEELSDLIDTAIVSQVENNQSRFRFTEQEIQGTEGAEHPVIMVERVGDLTNTASVSLSFADIQTTEEVDYHSSDMLEWAAGEGGAKTLAFEVVDDDNREGNETLVMMLEPGNGSVLDAPHTAHLTIVDNDLNESLDEWEDLDAFNGSIVWKVVFGEGKFVGAGGRELSWWSHNFEETGFEEFPSFSFLDKVYYLNGKFIAAGVDSRIIVSEDGEDWEVVNVDSYDDVVDVAYGNEKYVAVGGYTSPYSYLDDLGMAWSSPDGYQWSLIYDRSHFEFEGVVFGAGHFLTWTWENLYRSADGQTWTLIDDQDELPIFLDVEWGDDVFVAVDIRGGILTSSDGLQWTPTEITEGLPLYSMTYRNGYFVAGGSNGRIVTSDDGGQSWKERYPGIKEILVQGVAAAGKMIVTGDDRTLVADLGEYFEFIQESEHRQVSVGELVELSADFVSSSEGGLSLQWQKDGIPISGAIEKTLVLESAYSVDAGEYRLAVTADDQTWFSPAIHLSLDKQQQAPELAEVATQSSYGVTLVWEDKSAHEEAYRVERREQGSETWVEVVNLAPDSIRYADRNLAPETTYQYRISAVAGDDVVSVVTDAITTKEATNLVNLSTRGLVGQDEEVMIGGFVIPEGPNMSLYIRGLGPSLTSSGISNTISNPLLRLVQTNAPEPLKIENDDWV
ncbi:MAG: Calx-beta domain-containing protein, partial [Opitutales bacterium]|nr:Calx-beta domain-containing protein [Opitutales bacterium]